MSIASEITRLQTAKADLKTAIEGKGVTVPSSATLDDYADLVDDIQTGGGGGSAEKKQVSFFDYDGTIVYSYTKEELAALDALPSNPVHTGLTAQGWNWSLANAKAYMTSYPNADLNIGQMYTTASGATEIDVSLNSNTLNPYLNIAVNGTVSVDWGDNSSPDTVTGTSETTNKFTAHTYAAPGDYTISITVSSGTFRFNAVVLSHTNSTSTGQKYIDTIKAIRIGTGTTYIGNLNNLYYLETLTIPNTVTGLSTAFWTCLRLKSITIPTSITNVPGNCFRTNRSIESVLLPYGLTTIGSPAFQDCNSLQYITIPPTVTSLGSYTFAGCTNLKVITIPSSITSIDHNTFNGDWSLQYVDIPSTVTSIKLNAFIRCYVLGNISLPNGIETITSSCFEDCNSFTSVTIPSSVTSIEANAFKNCHVGAFHIKPTTPPSLANTNAFNMRSDAAIYVPAGTLSTYQGETNWSSFASYMQEEPA